MSNLIFALIAGLIVGFFTGIVFLMTISRAPKNKSSQTQKNYDGSADWLLGLDECELKISE